MPALIQDAPVLEQREVAPGVFLLRVGGAFTAEPGQFFLLRAWGLHPLLSRPLSVHDLAPGSLSFLYAVRGEGTRLLSRLRPGDRLRVFGPLGRGWSRAEGRIALVGGGLGLAPLYYTAKAFGPPLDIFLGFRDAPFLVEAFRPFGEVRVALERPGGLGEAFPGLVTELFQPQGYAAVYACGPRPMLEALYRKCRAAGVPLYVSLEERLACGIGACLGCTILTARGPARLCREGPVFPAEEVFHGP
ncbi:MAG: dihydroorotate dehydrogenase electron transfer subunit [Candidatus Bipolaricaulota bacterium]|nr:dihydroorotate dehydrogenase electron transfer subunit [Candidatus Bipolaricaulota bacterium]MCX7844586.1 dihydroorotate dehydrogenase electron transfer subunit [Candidatus Bipolaricaulota bacterium]MDW8152472.1 dihydroorotate dehydrogenase electron transfer subunit [Candidatus Bipolaricaulota bacterium]